MADSGKFDEAGSDGINAETNATINQSPGMNSPTNKLSGINKRSNSTDLGIKQGGRYTNPASPTQRRNFDQSGMFDN